MICVMCGNKETGASNKKYCDDCRKIRDRQIRNNWKSKNKEKTKAYMKEYMAQYRSVRKKDAGPSICKRCGSEFVKTSSRQKYCPKCGIDMRLNKTIVKKVNKRISPLSVVERQARSHGMSYGNYVAMMYDRTNMVRTT